MAITQINGGTQIQSGTITSAQLSSSAGITSAQLATAYLPLAGGTMTGQVNGGAQVATNFGAPVGSTDLATKGYVDAATQGISGKYSATVATTGSESFTIASGTVTSITAASGGLIDGVAVAQGEYVLIKNAPSATGVGIAAGTAESTNGLYLIGVVSGTTVNVSRASDMSAGSPSGAAVFVESGTKNGATGWLVTSPSNPTTTFTYGTTAMGWTQVSAATVYTTDNTLTLAGTQFSRAAITGNVSIPAGSNVATIGAAQVTMAMLNATGTAGTTTWLRGDGSWQALPAPANGSITFAMLAASAVETSGTAISSSSTDSELPTAKAVYNYVTSAVSASGGGTVTSVSVASANGFAGTVATATSTPAITIETTITGLLKGNGTAISAAVAGTDYQAPINFVVRETPSGTPNGSTTSFGLAHTPVSGSEELFLNGVLQDSGTGNDYTISGATITMLTAPASTDKLRCSYRF